jgi:hypothetical protein
MDEVMLVIAPSCSITVAMKIQYLSAAVLPARAETRREHQASSTNETAKVTCPAL